MKWFKHISDSLDDPFIFDLMTQFGHTGYVVFFGVLEIYAREFSPKDGWILREKLGYFRRKLRVSSGNFRQILEKISKWEVCFDGDSVSIFIPKFKELMDESTLKKLREKESSFRNRSGMLPKTDTTDADADADAEEDKDIKAEGRPVDNPVPFDSVIVPKTALIEEPKTEQSKPGNGKDDAYLEELKNLVAQVKTKYPRYPIEQWYGRNIKCPPDKILQVLRHFVKAELRFEANAVIDKYLQNSIDVETGKTNARLFEAEQEWKKGPPTRGGMMAMGKVLAGIGGRT